MVTLPNRSTHFGVGIETDDGVFLHRDSAVGIVPQDLIKWANAIDALQGYAYRCPFVKWNWSERSLSLYLSPMFHNHNDPAYQEIYRLSAGGKLHENFLQSYSAVWPLAQVLFHKWLLVPDGYPFFNVQAAKARSRWLLKLPYDLSEIETYGKWQHILTAVAKHDSHFERVITAIQEDFNPDPWSIVFRNTVADYIAALQALEEECDQYDVVKHFAPYEVETSRMLFPYQIRDFMEKNECRGYVFLYYNRACMFSDQETAALFRMTFA